MAGLAEADEAGGLASGTEEAVFGVSVGDGDVLICGAMGAGDDVALVAFAIVDVCFLVLHGGDDILEKWGDFHGRVDIAEIDGLDVEAATETVEFLLEDGVKFPAHGLAGGGHDLGGRAADGEGEQDAVANVAEEFVGMGGGAEVIGSVGDAV